MAPPKTSVMRHTSAVVVVRHRWWCTERFQSVRRPRSIPFTALVLALAGGRRQPGAFAQGTCGTTSAEPFRIEDLSGAQALGAAVNCTDGGTVEAEWAGAVTLDAPIAVGSGTFLYITGEDELAEVQGDSQTRMFEVSPSGLLSLTQLTLSGGNADNGGAIHSRMATITLESCVFEGNVADDGDGGAVFAEGGELTVVGGEFSSNNASQNGGAVSVVGYGILDIQDGTQFRDNFAKSMGGALYGGSNATMTVDGCTFEKNFTPGYGGAVAASSAILQGGTLLTDNRAEKDGGGVRDLNVGTNLMGSYVGATRRKEQAFWKEL